MSGKRGTPLHHCMQSTKYLTFLFKFAVKKRKANTELGEAMCILGEMERAAEECAEERDMKRRKLEWEMEKKRREAERRHEERMQFMFMNFMKEMTMGRQHWMTDSFPAGGHSSNYLHGTYNYTMDEEFDDHTS